MNDPILELARFSVSVIEGGMFPDGVTEGLAKLLADRLRSRLRQEWRVAWRKNGESEWRVWPDWYATAENAEKAARSRRSFQPTYEWTVVESWSVTQDPNTISEATDDGKD